MKTIQIKHRYTRAILYTTEVDDSDPQPMRMALERAYLADADLAGAYLAGAYLADADLAGAYLADADLAGAYLAGAYLAGAYLADANLADANLADADLADANLAGANLAGAYLADANLAGANLAGARHVPTGVTATDPTDPPTPYHRRAVTVEDRRKRQAARAAVYREQHPDVPVIECLDAKILDAIGKDGCRLDMSDWHHGDPCGTTHCRAGWAVFLAGAAGAELERKTSCEEAARAIYLASTGRVPHFFATDERALEDLKRCAAEQSEATS